VRVLYTPVIQGVLLVVALIGLAAFVRHLAGGTGPTAAAGTLPALIAGFALHVLMHEAAHAATAKHFGAEVRRAGIGWYFFAPVAFVDTSDIWAAARLPRVLVSAAGPYSNLVLSGIAGLCAAPFPSGQLASSLWSVAAMGYALACINMNPLLELDGYYIAMDLLEVPNLRARAFACLGALFREGRRVTEDQRLRRILTVFGAASVIYGAAMAVGIVLVCHANITSLAGTALPFACVQAIGWGGAGIVGLLLLTKLVGELRRS
jgi:putative peptide zinc metalloprotease protein